MIVQVQYLEIRSSYSLLTFPLTVLNREWVIAELAIIMAGGVVVHVSFNITNARDVYDTISTAECRSVFIDPGKGDEYLDIILQLNECIVKDSNISSLMFLRKSKHLTSYDDVAGVLQSKDENEVEFPKLYPEDVIVIFTTSGSTGNPKLIPKTHFHTTNNDNLYSGKTYNDRSFAWSSGSPIRTVYLGEPRVFCDSSIAIAGRNTMKIWEIIKEEQCTSALLLPYFLSDLAANEENYKEPLKLDVFITGGQPVYNLHTKVFGVFTKTLVVAYGSTEGFRVSMLPPITAPGETQASDVGKPIPGTEMKIIDGDGNVLRKHENGELCIRSMYDFEKYYKNTELMTTSFCLESGFVLGILRTSMNTII
ncbi:2,3-dihydroxybenzoate-AMP ligase-like [Ostrea edulis]|uniref:2,3-dihydroxybenzoate-AMP ligase-like n=1 Tax=Ostrea edulis TaxID=37623 RepID=UPI0024AEE236|nr:2,3-dihydroxybenzoate-AMP ligase-like [Ostrea edulis]